MVSKWESQEYSMLQGLFQDSVHDALGEIQPFEQRPIQPYELAPETGIFGNRLDDAARNDQIEQRYELSQDLSRRVRLSDLRDEELIAKETGLDENSDEKKTSVASSLQ
eukprot:747533-Rhodomonas_salina.2